ncbi:MAG: hypothetical protein ACI9WU_005531, partial [Myxococcota bacterium]
TVCSGTTGVCGSSAPYRESDQAHTDTGFFHVFHRAVFDSDSATVALQIHGFGSDPEDPEFTFSDGRTSNQPAGHISNELASALEILTAAAGSTKGGNSCNDSSGFNLLCGTTNTQGRYSNGVAQGLACGTSSSSASQRFIHMEMSFSLRSPTGSLGPWLVSQAVETVFPIAP